MGTYQEVNGDLLQFAKEGQFDVIAHGANCQQMMGAGIAKQIREKYSPAYLADKKDKRSSLSRLGDLTAHQFSSVCVVNLYTQLYGGPNLDKDALKLCLKKLNFLCAGKKLGLPQIGCGIAGGDWEEVKPIIKKYLKSCHVTVVIYKK